MKIYGIPNCDTVKKTRAWLGAHGIEAEFHDYKKQGVPLDVLRKAAKQLGWEALVNKKGPTWRKQPDDVKAAVNSEKAAFAFLQDHLQRHQAPAAGEWRHLPPGIFARTIPRDLQEMSATWNPNTKH